VLHPLGSTIMVGLGQGPRCGPWPAGSGGGSCCPATCPSRRRTSSSSARPHAALEAAEHGLAAVEPW